MKKRLEAELISIAHRILKLKNKSELIQLHQETQKLYETLSVLRFVEENMETVQPKMDVAEIEEKLETAFDQKEKEAQNEQPFVTKEVFEEVNAATEPELKEDFATKEEVVTKQEQVEVIAEEKEPEIAVEEVPETKIEEETLFTPSFELEKEEEITKKIEPAQISFEDLLGHQYNEPIFDKVSAEKEIETPVFEEKENKKVDKIEEVNEIMDELIELHQAKAVANAKSISGIQFGLNDRIGFEKHLFDGSSEDMNRVISQLSTFNTFQEAKEFIEDMVKPDYNNWKGQEDYAERFIEIVAQKFS